MPKHVLHLLPDLLPAHEVTSSFQTSDFGTKAFLHPKSATYTCYIFYKIEIHV